MLDLARDVGAADRDLLSACSAALAGGPGVIGVDAAPNSLDVGCSGGFGLAVYLTAEDDDDAASFLEAHPRDSSRFGRLDCAFGSGELVLRLAFLDFDLPRCSSVGFSLSFKDLASALSLLMHSSMR